MKSKKEKIEKNEPGNIPVITSQMMEKTAIETAKRKAGKDESPVIDVKDIKCPSCGTASMGFLNDLVFDVILASERIVIPNLTGLKCTKCGEQAFDSKSTRIIEKYTTNRPIGGYECNISIVGGGKIGIYFPKDILRVMKINKNEKAVLTPLSSHKMLVELVELTA
jgi:YgiT-type zinc finger domain-containing protein